MRKAATQRAESPSADVGAKAVARAASAEAGAAPVSAGWTLFAFGASGAAGAAPGAAGAANDSVRRAVSAPGHALQPTLRRQMEQHFGSPLDGVNLHTDALAAEAARGLHARAFATGPHIVFGADEFAPDTSRGKHLLAHELAHVVQQHGHPTGGAALSADGPQSAALRLSRPGDGSEREAEQAADALDAGLPAPRLSPVAAPLLQRYDDEEAGVCTSDPEPPRNEPDEFGVCEAPPVPVAPELQRRIDAFKQLVRTTAIHRLIANQYNLGLWSAMVEKVIPAADIGAVGLSMSGGARAYVEMQDIDDPGLRELRATQAVGRNRACTGCHLENRLWGSREERRAEAGPFSDEWLSPNDRRAGATNAGIWSAPLSPPLLAVPNSDDASVLSAWLRSQAAPVTPAAPAGPSASALAGPGYVPPAGTLEGTLNATLPPAEEIYAAMERVAPIIAQLGPDGYKVLPDSILGELETGSMAQLRLDIIAAIRQRVADYDTLIGKIRDGEVDWEFFGPIITDLLPLADAEVRAAIQEEMDDQAFWDRVESVVVGVLTVAALLLAIFPPTTALGLVALGALEVGLAGYGLHHGLESMERGGIYALGVGADDVFSEAQQQAASGMIIGGFVSTVLAPLGAVGGLARVGSGTARLFSATDSTAMVLARPGALTGTAAHTTEAAGELAASGGTFTRGRFVITVAEDGSMTASIPSQPDLLIIVRDGTATLYQSTGTGLRVLESVPLDSFRSAATAAGSAADDGVGMLALPPGAPPPLMLTAGSRRVPASWVSSPEFNALAPHQLPPVGAISSEAAWVRMPDGSWALELPAGVGEGSTLTTYGSSRASFLVDVPEASRTAVVAPRTGASYGGSRSYPMDTPDMLDPATGVTGARSHLIPHADTPTGALLSTADDANYVDHLSHVYNERIRRTLEARFRTQGTDWFAYNVMGSTPRVSAGGYPIPEAEIIIQNLPGGGVRAWRFPNDPAVYSALPADFDTALAPFELAPSAIPRTPVR